jgi:hypothetical protein
MPERKVINKAWESLYITCCIPYNSLQNNKRTGKRKEDEYKYIQ